MKILYHHRTLAADGQEVHIRSMLQAFRDEGHEVLEVALVPKGPSSRQDKEPTRRQGPRRGLLRRILSLPRPLLELAEHAYTVPGARRLLVANRGFGADLLYERYAFGNRAGALAARRLGIPFVLEVNSPLVDELSATRGIVFSNRARRVERTIFSAADLVCAVSGQLRDILVDAGVPSDRVLVLPNGVDIEQFRWPRSAGDRDRGRSLIGIEAVDRSGEPAVLVGFVGYFRRWHALDLLIRAFAGCREETLHLVLIGDGEDRDALVSLAEDLGISDRVHILGARPLESIPELLAGLDIAVLPGITRYASPLKLIEYMAAGLAIVAPDQPNVRELLGDRHSALLFQPADSDGLAAALSELATNDRLRERLGAAGRATVEERRLTWRSNVRRIEQAISKGPIAR